MTTEKDISLTEDRSWEVASDGDLAIASGQDLVKQDPAVRLFNQVSPNLAQGVTPLFVEEFESDIESALDDSEYVEGPYDVNVVNVNGETVTVNVSTAEMDITRDFNLNN